VHTLARWFFWGYAGMLVGIGASGVFVAPWELRTVFALPLDALDAARRASILNQYRFLKSVEFAFGVFCVLDRAAIFTPSASRRLFLTGVFGGVFARTASLLADGMPHWAFLAFAALELVTGVLVWRAA
jgi:hypothetical protein